MPAIGESWNALHEDIRRLTKEREEARMCASQMYDKLTDTNESAEDAIDSACLIFELACAAGAWPA